MSPINVLIYSGDGTSVEAIRQTTEALRFQLSPNYAVSTITTDQLLKEPWQPSTALLVMPGGRDLPYCRDLHGKGCQLIREYIKAGGRFLGLCAAAYFACQYCLFEEGTEMEVRGSRELALFPGTGRGAAFRGFRYGSNSGSHAALVDTPLGQMHLLLNGGCFFDKGEINSNHTHIRVLGAYLEQLDLGDCAAPIPQNPPGIVSISFGQGRAVLSGLHLEYDVQTFDSTDVDPQVIQFLKDSNSKRLEFLKFVLSELGLSIPEHQSVPRDTPGYLSLASKELYSFFSNFDSGANPFNDADGDFEFTIQDSANTITFVKSLHNFESENTHKVIVVNRNYPGKAQTPYFGHDLYFSSLAHESKLRGSSLSGLGHSLVYCEVIESTSTLLSGNPKLLSGLPHGTLVTATQQTLGRGRGHNVWVSPIGMLPVSGILRLKVSTVKQSLVFLQYLVSLAVIEAVESFGPQYHKLGLRLKWPNDIYINKDGDYVKIGGVLVTVHHIQDEFVLVFGAGVNVHNAEPNTCINKCISKLNESLVEPLKHVSSEELLAKTVTRLDEMWGILLNHGFSPFEQRYYRAWLHNDQIVQLEDYGSAKAKILGVALNTGMLRVQEVDSQGNPGQRIYELQPDGNSFDMMRGLIRKKM